MMKHGAVKLKNQTVSDIDRVSAQKLTKLAQTCLKASFFSRVPYLCT